MRFVCYDTESPVGYVECGVPELVCLTYVLGDEPRLPRLVVGDEAIDLWLSWVRDPDVIHVCHNAPHDLSVLAGAVHRRETGEEPWPGEGPYFALSHDLYAADRVRCTLVRQRLRDIAAGQGYLKAGLGPLMARLFGVDLADEKDPPKKVRDALGTGRPVQEWSEEAVDASPWRFKYGLLQGIPPGLWPAQARSYALDDPVNTWRVYEDQAGDLSVGETEEAGEPDLFARFANEVEQTSAAWDLFIMSRHGLEKDRARVRRILDLYEGVRIECQDLLVGHGLVREEVVHRGKPNERVDRTKPRAAIQAIVWQSLGSQAEVTKGAAKLREAPRPDNIRTDAKALGRVITALGGKPTIPQAAIEAYQEGRLSEHISEGGAA